MTPEKEIDRIVREDIPLTREITFIHRRMRAETAVKRNELREVYDRFAAEENVLRSRRKALRQEILRIWKKHFNGKSKLDLPSAKVTRSNMTSFKINDIAAVIDALDRADRLDLVTYTLDEHKVKRLVLDGKLEGLPEGAVTIESYYQLGVGTKEKLHGKKTLSDYEKESVQNEVGGDVD